MIEKSFRTYLASLTSLPIYWIVLPQDVEVGIALRKSTNTDDKISNGSSSMQVADFEVDVWGARYQDARIEADSIKRQLLNYVGAMDADYCGGVNLSRDFDDLETATETDSYRVALAFRVFYRNT